MKLDLFEYLVNIIQNEIVLQMDEQVVKMFILLLVKILKLSWFDDSVQTTNFKNMVQEV